VTSPLPPERRAELHVLVDQLLDQEPLWEGALRAMIAVVRYGNGLSPLPPPLPAPTPEPDPDQPLTWRQRGLEPEAGFIEEECLVDAEGDLSSAEVFQRFCSWWTVNALGKPGRQPSRRLLGLRLNDYGFGQFRAARDGNRTHWRGIAWRDPEAFLLQHG